MVQLKIYICVLYPVMRPKDQTHIHQMSFKDMIRQRIVQIRTLKLEKLEFNFRKCQQYIKKIIFTIRGLPNTSSFNIKVLNVYMSIGKCAQNNKILSRMASV